MKPAIATGFADLIAPMSPESFRDRIQGRGAHHFPGADDRFRGLFSWQALQQLLGMTQLWSEHTMNVVFDGKAVAAEEYCTRGQDRAGHGMLMADMARVDRFLAQGATLVLDRVETLVPGLWGIALGLRSVFGASAVCNLYCSFRAHQGFASHYDTTDVIALQIEGSKRWNIYQGRELNPVPHAGPRFSDRTPEQHARARGDLLTELEMSPGDVLYLPRGQYHDALASSEDSLHLSFGLTRATGLDFMSVLSRSLPDDDLMREELPHFDDVAATSAHLQRLGQRVMELLCDPALAQQSIAWQRERVFRDLPASTLLPERSRLIRVRVCQRPFRLEERGDGALLRSASSELALDPACARAARGILAAEVFLASDLVSQHGLDEEQTHRLLDDLAGAGVIEPI